MTTLIRTTAILFAMQLRALLRSKRFLVCALIALAPTAAALFVCAIARAHGEAIPTFELAWLFVVQSTVPLIALILGSAVIAEEIEDRTVTYLFTRPVPRASVLLGRLLAAVLVAVALCWLAAEPALLVVQRAGESIVDPEPRIAAMLLPDGMRESIRQACLIGAVVYTTMFAVAGAILKHPMIVGIGYTFVIEGFVGMLPGQNATATVQYHLKSLVAGGSEAHLLRMRELFGHQELAPAGESLQALWTTALVALALGLWIVSRKQYVMQS